MDIIRKEELTQILDEIVTTMEGAKDELIELDGAMGDGDLGLTMEGLYRRRRGDPHAR